MRYVGIGSGRTGALGAIVTEWLTLKMNNVE